MPKRIVSLYGLTGLGLIIDWPSGIFYSNQTGGTSCLQPEREGVFVPIANDLTPENEILSVATLFSDYSTGPKYAGSGACNGLDPQDADHIETLLRASAELTFLHVDRTRLKESHEAWLHVTILGEEDVTAASFSGFAPYPRRGVLTWQNSD